MATETTILDQGYGYGFVVGLGAAFALLMILVTHMLSKYMGEVQNSEHFSTASRSVKSGLISSAVVSSWTWPGTLLTSSNMAYTFGVSGCYFYGVGGTIQVIFFTMLAIQLKKNCPGAHTIVEVVKLRYGSAGHLMYVAYAIATNAIVSSMLLLGGSQAISVLTGMHVVACAFLLPVFVAAYTMLGGLKSTFLSDWTHTVIIYTVIIVTMFVAYATSSHIGSIDKMYDLLERVSETYPSGGYNGSYMTFRNPDAFYFFWNITISAFATVFGDPSYGQKAIAAAPMSSMVGYIVGGLCWQVVPWALGTCGALSALALTLNKVSPVYPNLIATEDVDKGMPMLYGLNCLMGKSGAAGGLLIVFMACTSSLSAEMIAFSSVITYDVYRPYFRPNAHGKDLVRMSHFATIFFAVAAGGLTVMFNYIGITISWILEFLGIILGPSVFGIVFTLFWKKASRLALLISMPLGSVTGALCWVGTCYAFSNGVVNKDTLSDAKTCFVGNFIGLFSTGIYMVIISLIKPDNFDFKSVKHSIKVGDDVTKEEEEIIEEDEDVSEQRKLKFASWFSLIFSIVYVLIFAFIVPLPMYGQKYIFSKTFFRAWVVIIFIWLWIAFLYITFYPLIESRDAIRHLFKRLMHKEAPQAVHLMDGRVLQSQEQLENQFSGQGIDKLSNGEETTVILNDPSLSSSSSQIIHLNEESEKKN